MMWSCHLTSLFLPRWRDDELQSLWYRLNKYASAWTFTSFFRSIIDCQLRLFLYTTSQMLFPGVCSAHSSVVISHHGKHGEYHSWFAWRATSLLYDYVRLRKGSSTEQERVWSSRCQTRSIIDADYGHREQMKKIRRSDLLFSTA